jgi:putative ABC transport system substrate-binding protein
VIGRRQLVLLLAASALVAPVASLSQPAKVWRIGVLENTSMVLNGANLGAFVRGMQELGYVEGRNFVIDYRSADGRYDRFPALAAEMIRGNVDVIVTRGTPATMAAAKVSSRVPIVVTATSEPLLFAATLARPGGNVTGLVSLTIELAAKRVQLLKEMNPKIARLAVFLDMSNAASPPNWKAIESAAQSSRMQALLVDVRRGEDLDRAFDAAVKWRADALHVGQEAFAQANASRIVALATKHRLPATYPSVEFVENGGLVSYGVSYPDLYRRAASYVDKILKGAKPGDLPIEQATSFDLVINVKAARALGLGIPPSLLVRADRVVQ